MSAKNRGKASILHDRYLTPPRLVRAVYEQLFERYGAELRGAKTFLEPAAGPGPFARLAPHYFPKLQRCIGVELSHKDKRSPYERIRKDFLSWETELRFDVAMCNPPYTHAEAFIRKTYELLSPRGCVLFLGRIGLAGSKKRRALWEDIPLGELWLCRPRPSFIIEGGTDSAEYAFFLMWKDAPGGPSETVFRFLDWDYLPGGDL